MIDLVKLHLQAGKGGDGRVSFRREKFVPRGGPDGGDGADGGSIFLRATKNINTLHAYAGKTGFKADDGELGGKKNMSGRKGQDLYLEVPIGTIVWEVTEGSLDVQKLQMIDEEIGVDHHAILRQKELSGLDVQSIAKKKIVELLKDGQEFEICKGGLGGRGNDRFKSASNRTPTEAEKGTLGQELEVIFEVKLLADVGLVGLPNAGKSTFLSLVSNANPKIANYAFTTLSPNLGVMEVYGKELVIADIPGLIEGANQGKGLGFQFLRHVERCRALMFVLFLEESVVFDINLSVTEKVEQVWGQYQLLQNELQQYEEKLLKLPFIITLNKVDLYPEELREAIVDKFKTKGREITLWSGSSRQGINELRELLSQL